MRIRTATALTAACAAAALTATTLTVTADAAAPARTPDAARTVAVPAAAARAAAARTAAAPDHGYGWTAVRSGVPDAAGRFRLTSPQVRDGGAFPASGYADAFGCTGPNHQITLHWSGAPAATRSYAVTMFDPDAPTGSGFWHWLVWDIPATARTLAPGTPPTGTVSGTDDAGQTGYLGPCPPAGDVPHHMRITVYALDTPTLSLPATTPAAVTVFTMSGHVLATADLTATARR